MGKPRLLGRGFSLLYDLIVADWVELVCNLNCFVFMELDGSGLDTLFCWLFWGMIFLLPPVWALTRYRRKAIQSFRLRLHSGLRQGGDALRACFRHV